jgi:membrane associated rhomboid family serine protease
MSMVVREVKVRVGVPVVFVAVMWLVAGANLLTHDALDAYGIRPRTVVGLWGILFSPFLHANLAHLLANTLPFLVLGWLVALRRLRDFLLVTAVVMLVGGTGVWLLGRPFSDHIGASGLVFGFLGFLLARGYFERSVTAIVLSLVALFLYGGILWGILPAHNGISWESHLFGTLGGLTAGRLLTRRAPAPTRSAFPVSTPPRALHPGHV